MPKSFARVFLRFPLTVPLVVLALFSFIATLAFLSHESPANIHTRSGFACLYPGEIHVPVPDAGVWLAFGPTGAQEVICRNGVRVPLAHDAWLVLAPSDLARTPIDGLSPDDFPFYRCSSGLEIIRCRDGRILRLPSLRQ
ncbi:MAG: hypothetical protein U0793_28650 [Gemmataceae bacterium]